MGVMAGTALLQDLPRLRTSTAEDTRPRMAVRRHRAHRLVLPLATEGECNRLRNLIFLCDIVNTDPEMEGTLAVFSSACDTSTHLVYCGDRYGPPPGPPSPNYQSYPGAQPGPPGPPGTSVVVIWLCLPVATTYTQMDRWSSAYATLSATELRTSFPRPWEPGLSAIFPVLSVHGQEEGSMRMSLPMFSAMLLHSIFRSESIILAKRAS